LLSANCNYIFAFVIGHSKSKILIGLSRYDHEYLTRKKNGFVTATKLGTNNNFFVAATKNFAAATKRFVDRT